MLGLQKPLIQPFLPFQAIGRVAHLTIAMQVVIDVYFCVSVCEGVDVQPEREAVC